jgi:cell division protein FtsB
MRKIIVNYYFLAILFVVAQAIFVVARGNSSIMNNKQIQAARAENQLLEQKVSSLESQLAHLSSIENAREHQTTTLVDIGARETVNVKSLAVLP